MTFIKLTQLNMGFKGDDAPIWVHVQGIKWITYLHPYLGETDLPVHGSAIFVGAGAVVEVQESPEKVISLINQHCPNE